MRRQATRASSTNSDNSSIGWRWHKAFRLPRSDRSWGKEYSEEFQREMATAKQRLHEKIEKLMRSVLKRRARQKPGTTSEPPEATGRKGAGLIEASPRLRRPHV